MATTTRFREASAAENTGQYRTPPQEGLTHGPKPIGVFRHSRLYQEGCKNAPISPAQKNTPDIMQWRKD